MVQEGADNGDCEGDKDGRMILLMVKAPITVVMKMIRIRRRSNYVMVIKVIMKVMRMKG